MAAADLDPQPAADPSSDLRSPPERRAPRPRADF